MATYSSYKELVGTVLTLKDDIKFKVKEEIYLYRVYSNHLSCKNKAENDIIFTALNIPNKNAFAAHIYGYTVCSGTGVTCWPEYNPDDYIAATNIVLTLFKLCEDYNKKYTKKEPVLSERKSLYKVGDVVVVKDQYDSEYGMFDYPGVFTPEMLKQYGGKKVTIAKVEPTIFDYKYRKFYKEGYQYKIKEDSGAWNWCAGMFKDKAEEDRVEKNQLIDASKSSEFSFTKDDIPKSCPYHPYVIDQAVEQRSRIRQITLKEAFKDVISRDVSYWFVWSNSSQGVPYWLNIFNNPSFIPKDYTPKYYKELSSARNETIEEVEEPTSGRPFTIPLSYEEVKLSLKKPTCKF